MKLTKLKQLLLLIIFIICAWILLHQHKRIPNEAYLYLQNIPPKLVLQCQTEGNNISPNAWLDLLAIKSSLPENESWYYTQQISDKRLLNKLNWGLLNINAQKLIKKRKSILVNNPYFNPSLYGFRVSGGVWYEDSYGADREGGKRKHEGTDLFSKEGTPIISVGPGKIEQLGWNRLGGERVGIRGEDGNYYYYAHLQQIAAQLQIGQKVTKGEYLGTMGHTGDAISTPDHLHFGIELANGEWINPYSFLVVWQSYFLNLP